MDQVRLNQIRIISCIKMDLIGSELNLICEHVIVPQTKKLLRMHRWPWRFMKLVILAKIAWWFIQITANPISDITSSSLSSLDLGCVHVHEAVRKDKRASAICHKASRQVDPTSQTSHHMISHMKIHKIPVLRKKS